MDETSAIKGIGQGFLTETGQLKSKEKLAAEETRDKRKAEKSSSDETAISNVSNALGSVRSRFRADANQVISAVNVNEDNLKEAKKLAEEQLETAKQLKVAIKDKDTEAIQARKEELNQLQEKRVKLAAEIERENSAQIDSSRKKLSLGNEQKGIVSVKPVEFEAREIDTAKLENKEQVDDLIKGFKEDLGSIKTQRQEQKETRAEVKDVVAEVEREISRIQEDSIRSFEQASRSADKVATDIRSGSQQVFNNVSVSAVQKLLAA